MMLFSRPEGGRSPVQPDSHTENPPDIARPARVMPVGAGPHPYDPDISITGRGAPLVFVPGMDGTGKLFYRQIPLLTDSYRVATYTLRDAAGSMDELIEDLAQVIDVVSPDGTPATIVGESFGGTLSMSFALAHPEKVAALVVLNSFPFFRPQHRLWLALHGLQLVPWGAMGMVRRLTAFRLHSRHTHRREIRRFLQLSKSIRKEGYLARLRVLRQYDIRERLQDIRVPTLFLASELDHLVPAVEQAELMASRVPNATLHILPGHGHICLIAPNVDLGRILREWQEELGERGSGPPS